VEPDLERFAMVGHSLGEWLRLKTATLTSKGSIPPLQHFRGVWNIGKPVKELTVTQNST
jgi:hypothetical protein